jgi:hypothetical protein
MAVKNIDVIRICHFVLVSTWNLALRELKYFHNFLFYFQ